MQLLHIIFCFIAYTVFICKIGVKFMYQYATHKCILMYMLLGNGQGVLVGACALITNTVSFYVLETVKYLYLGLM